jgi:hypothetical protein
MDIQFENNYTYSHKLVLEYHYKIAGKRMLIYSIIALLGALAYGIIGLVTDRVTWYVVLAFVAFAIYCAWYPYYFTKKNEKERNRRNGGAEPVTRVLFGEEIDCSEGDVEFSAEYQDINKVFILKNGIFLTTKGRRGIALERESFIKGEAEAFLPFLREKCPHAEFINK